MYTVSGKFLTNFFVMGIVFVMLCIPVEAIGARTFVNENYPPSGYKNRMGTGIGKDFSGGESKTRIEDENTNSTEKQPEAQVSSRSIQADNTKSEGFTNDSKVDTNDAEVSSLGDTIELSAPEYNKGESMQETQDSEPKEVQSFYQRIQSAFKSLFNGAGFSGFWDNLFGGEVEKNDLPQTKVGGYNEDSHASFEGEQFLSENTNSLTGASQNEPETILKTQSTGTTSGAGGIVRSGIVQNPDISDLIQAGDGGGSETIQEGKQTLVNFMENANVPKDMQALFLAESMTEHHEIPKTLERQDESKDGETDMNIGTFNDNVDILVTYGGLEIPMEDGTFKNTKSENFSWDNVDWDKLNEIYGDGPYGNGPTEENLKKIVDAKIKALNTLGVERYLVHRRAGADAFVDAGNTLGEDGLPIIRDEDYGDYEVEDADEWFRGHSYWTQQLLDDPSKMTDNRRYAFVFDWI